MVPTCCVAATEENGSVAEHHAAAPDVIPATVDALPWVVEHRFLAAQANLGQRVLLPHAHLCGLAFNAFHRLHLDYRGLILAGLAVSVHDLPTNPYE